VNGVVPILLVASGLLLTALLGLVRTPGQSATHRVYGLAALLCGIGFVIVLGRLVAMSDPAELTLPLGLPWIGMRLRIDALASFFLLIVDLGGLIACIFGMGYGLGEPEPRRVLPFVPAFLAAMHLVLLADDAFTFLVAWEFMSLSSWALVLARPEDPESGRAALVYVVMAAFGTACLLLAFGLLAGPQGGYDFAAMRVAKHAPWVTALATGLVLLGTGSKAGLVPLHAWLPLAHPAAPSHVSALMSGVMTKIAIYAALRLLLDLVGDLQPWWGPLLMMLGAASAVLGLLYAIMETDLKRLLAYSTVENIGFIFAAIGLALAFRSSGLAAGMALSLTAALLHALNHMLFKGLLFMGSGAVLHATGSREMDRQGGLIHRMPVTSVFMLVGACAISALPPLNGFVSEWLLFQAVLQSPEVPSWSLRFLSPAVGALLALAAALAATCFVRAYGIVFLGRPRTPEAATAHEVDRWSLAGLALPAVLCVLLGVFPGPVIDLLAPVVAELNGGIAMPAQGGFGWLSLVPVEPQQSSYNGLILLLFIAVSASLVAALVHRLASRRLTRGPIWDCGYPEPATDTQYGASSFGQPIRRVFGTLAFRARERVDMPRPGDMRPARLSVSLRDLVWDMLYRPVGDTVLGVADRLNRLQFLTIRMYLSLMFGALVTLLVVVALWR
jgi:formate hydrogenlyase subunit 3/multisubunit Na+/H+ antiporter MnhD subunit